MNPDPSICRVGADFYLVTSSFEYFPGVPIFHSRDLVNWTQIGHVLTRERQLDLAGVYSSGGIYAPTLRHHAGRFYMITTLVGSPNHGGNFFVTAEDPRGPWSDPIWIDSEASIRRCCSRTARSTTCGTARAPTTDHPRVYQARIDPATGTLREPMRVIWEGTGGIWPEGAHVYKMKGRYYLFAAEGGTSYGHAEVVGRSDSPFGPFEPFAAQPDPDAPRSCASIRSRRRATPIWSSSTTGRTWAVFLGDPPAGRPLQHLGRETFLAPVRCRRDGWPTIGDGGRVELRMPAPALRAAAAARAAGARRLRSPERWRRRGTSSATPNPGDLSLDRAPGFLRLTGSAVTLDDVASPAAGRAAAAALPRPLPRGARLHAARRPNEEAGLTVRANEALPLRPVGAAGRAGPRGGAVDAASPARRRSSARVPLADGPVMLEVSRPRRRTRSGRWRRPAPRVLGVLPRAGARPPRRSANTAGITSPAR